MTEQKLKEEIGRLREMTKNTGNKKVEEWRKDLIEENPEGFRFWMAKHKIEGYLEANQNNLEKSFKQFLCPQGHYWTAQDVYDTLDEAFCPTCKKRAVWHNMVDEGLIGFIDLKVKKIKSGGICTSCGKEHICETAIYEIPKEEIENVDWKKISEKIDKDIEEETKNFLKELKGGSKNGRF